MANSGARAEDALVRAAREAVPGVVARLTRRYGDFAAAEDAVQEALVEAVRAWGERGVPGEPAGWLARVAQRRLIDLMRAESARRAREERVAGEPVGPPPDVPGERPDEGAFGDGTGTGAGDDTLTLFFLCCHPALTDASAVALTLRAVGGLTTAEIAHAFLVPEATMAQRISRAKRRLAESGEPLGLPARGTQDWERRRAAVLKVLYLVFSEGYAASGGPALRRVELAREAIRLGRALRAVLPGDPEVAGLLALMVLTEARGPARTGPAGELVPLGEQDRTRWDRAAITEGTALITATLAAGGPVGPYQVQAAIAAVHDEAPDAAGTDWAQIAALYGVLERIAPSPVVSLNRAVAVAMTEGPEAGLRVLDTLTADPRLAGHHRLPAVRGHLLERAGRRAEAAAEYRVAAARARTVPERDYLLVCAARSRGEVGEVGRGG
jgi:RNA polymerase sigma factor (sigma-70 family)